MAVSFLLFLGNRAEDVVNYPLYLILGNTAFQLMNDATTMGMRSIIDASSLLKKVRINRVVFPVQKVLFAVVNYLFSLIAVGIVMLVFRIPLTIYSLLTPVALLLRLVFASVLQCFSRPLQSSLETYPPMERCNHCLDVWYTALLLR